MRNARTSYTEGYGAQEEKLGLSKTPYLVSGLIQLLNHGRARNTRKYFQAEPVFLTWYS